MSELARDIEPAEILLGKQHRSGLRRSYFGSAWREP